MMSIRILVAGLTFASMVFASEHEPTGFEITGPAIKSAPSYKILEEGGAPAAPEAAMAAPQSTLPPSEIPVGALAQSDARLKKLESYILGNDAMRKATQLRNDPRLHSLPERERSEYLSEYSRLMTSDGTNSRDSLLRRTSKLDDEDFDMTQRAIKHREQVAAYEMDKAVLGNQIAEHNKRAEANKNAVAQFNNDLVNLNRQREAYSSRLASYSSQVQSFNSESSSYGAQCAGRSLPPGPYQRCMSWQSQLLSRKASLDQWKGRLDSERNQLNNWLATLRNRKAALDRESAQINERKAQLDKPYQEFERRRKELNEEREKILDWQRTIKPQWDHEVELINEWIGALNQFNSRLEAALKQVQPPKSEVRGFDGKWEKPDQGVVTNTLDGIKDPVAKEWLSSRARLGRFPSDGVSPLSANGKELKFKDEYFHLGAAARQNYLGFEGGKAVYDAIKDRKLPNGKTVASWFTDFSGTHGELIWDMRNTKDRGFSFAKTSGDSIGVGDVADIYSQFGHVFRANALQLHPPAGNAAKQKEWRDAIQEFRSQINPLLESGE